MMFRTYFFNRLNSHIKLLITAVITVIFLSACVSYDSVQEGKMNTLYHVNGASLIMDKGVDKLVALGVRNDSSGELQVRVRAIGGEIGFNYYTGSSSGMGYSSDNVVRAAYITTGNDASLAPGKETIISIFLKNWYLANKDFKHRMEVVIDNGVETHAINIYVSQDDIFDDAKKTFQRNKLGENDPSSHGAVHIGVGNLPANFTITIPLN